MTSDAGSIQGIAGVVIFTDDPRTMTEFYRDVLGLIPHSMRPDGVQFKWGEMRLTINPHSEVHGKTTEPFRIMINLTVGDIHAVAERLRARGVSFIREPDRERWGWLATFHDPDGNTLQLLQNDPRPAR
ncbi:MAG: VOC family protein [Chloroflexi bacterium]|nr:VOC family protein [Chloroflexota bacterium]